MKTSSLIKLILILLSIALAVYMVASGNINRALGSIGELGIIGIFIAGVCYGSAFTAAPAVATLILFTNSFNPLVIAFIGALGTMAGDYLIFHLVKDKIPKRADNFLKYLGVQKLRELKKTKFYWVLPLITAVIIASPLPDEIGVSLLGLSKFDSRKFLVLSFSLNFLGLLILTGLVWIL